MTARKQNTARQSYTADFTPGATFFLWTQPKTAVVWRPTGTATWRTYRCAWFCQMTPWYENITSSVKANYIMYVDAVTGGPSHGHIKNLVKFSSAVVKVCKQTNKQTYSSQYFAPPPGGDAIKYLNHKIHTDSRTPTSVSEYITYHNHPTLTANRPAKLHIKPVKCRTTTSETVPVARVSNHLVSVICTAYTSKRSGHFQYAGQLVHKWLHSIDISGSWQLHRHYQLHSISHTGELKCSSGSNVSLLSVPHRRRLAVLSVKMCVWV